MSSAPSTGTAVVLDRRPSKLQVTLLVLLGLVLSGGTALSVVAVRQARETADTLARLEYVAREISDLEVMSQEAYLAAFQWSVYAGERADVERELALIDQKTRSMAVSAAQIGFEDELAAVMAEVSAVTATLDDLQRIEAQAALNEISALRNSVRFDLAATVRPKLQEIGVSTDALGSLFGWFTALGAAMGVLISAIFVVTRRDVRKNYERGHAALLDQTAARQRAESLNVAQVEIAELIAAGVDRNEVVERCRTLLDSITGRTWLALDEGALVPADDGSVSTEEYEAITAFWRLLDIAAERDRLHDLLTRRALHDDLTGLRNRAGLVDRLEHALSRRRPAGEALAVLFVDLDRFKQVNDSYGHRAGDELLRTIGSRLSDMLRRADTVSRPGGDEFVVILDGVAPDHIVAIAERLHGRMIEPVPLESGVVTVGASVGVYEIDGSEADAEDVLRRADAAMYEAKSGHGGVVVFDDQLRAAAEGRLNTERGVRRALDEDGFIVHYQPVVDVDAGTVAAVEAFVRWELDGRLLMPDEFLSAAEGADLIVGIDNQLLRRSVAAFARWGLPTDVRLAVNFSGRTLSRPQLVGDVERILDGHGLTPERLTVDVNDEMVLRSPESAAVVQSLREIGVRIAWDDFGTSLASMGNLDDLPVDVIKIDGRLIRRLSTEPEDPVVAAMITVGHGLGLTVVAEGVETEAEAGALRALGCRLHQGYLYARPAPDGELRLDGGARFDRPVPDGRR